jgi:hypothetical protein
MFLRMLSLGMGAGSHRPSFSCAGIFTDSVILVLEYGRDVCQVKSTLE